MASGLQMAVARARWDMLRSVLLEKKNSSSTSGYKSIQPNFASVRRFSSFDLFTVSVSPNTEVCHGKDEDGAKVVDGVMWFKYIHKSSAVEIALLPLTFSSEELQGFNNTGNVCIWPSEEVMAYFCLENLEEFKGRSVCELGAGMSGLAGMFVAKMCSSKEVFVTDGNERSVINLRSIIRRNELSTVTTEVVIWKDSIIINDKYKHLKGRFDIILCSDCLFFSEVHRQLITLLLYLMKSSGKVYMFSPERNGTMKTFCTLAEDQFDIKISEKYLDIVWEKHVSCMNNLCVYNPDIHYPKLMIMKKKE